MARERTTGRKAAYRRKNQNRFSMVLVGLVVVLITVAVAMRSMELTQRNEELSEKEAQLQQ